VKIIAVQCPHGALSKIANGFGIGSGGDCNVAL